MLWHHIICITLKKTLQRQAKVLADYTMQLTVLQPNPELSDIWKDKPKYRENIIYNGKAFQFITEVCNMCRPFWLCPPTHAA